MRNVCDARIVATAAAVFLVGNPEKFDKCCLLRTLQFIVLGSKQEAAETLGRPDKTISPTFFNA
jgi:hypothetical protein